MANGAGQEENEVGLQYDLGPMKKEIDVGPMGGDKWVQPTMDEIGVFGEKHMPP